MHDRLVSILAPNRVFAIVRECTRDFPFPVYVGGSTITYAVWEAVFGGHKAPDDLDCVYFDPDGDFRQETLGKRISDCTGLDVSVYNQAAIHRMPKFQYRPQRTSLADAVKNYCDTPACVVARVLDDGTFDILAPHGLDDLFAGRVRVTDPMYTAEVIRRAKRKDWQHTWPQLQVIDAYGAPFNAKAFDFSALLEMERELHPVPKRSR